MHATTRRFTQLALVLCMSFATVAMAKDIAGGKDHPFLSRFAGSQLEGYQEIDFGQGDFYLADPQAPKKELQMDKPVSVEGKLSRLVYLAPKGKTPLEVHRNYEQALQAAGATVKTSVNGTGAWWEPAKHWRQQFGALKFQNGWAVDVSPFWRDGLYTYAVFNRGGRELHISVMTAQNFAVQDAQQAAVAVQIIEPAAMATGQVTVNADAMKKGLVAEGKIALYGIYFDTGKADVKPESAPQLEQIALLTRQNANDKFFVVGHTDNQGSYESNVALSQRRAEAVVAALVKTHKVDARRLSARGVANVSPVASNAAETGRSKNRRVELVLQ